MACTLAESLPAVIADRPGAMTRLRRVRNGRRQRGSIPAFRDGLFAALALSYAVAANTRVPRDVQAIVPGGALFRRRECPDREATAEP